MTIKIPKDHIVLLTPRERVRQAAEMGAVWGGVVVGFALLASVTPWAVAAGLIAAGARTVWIVRKAVVSERQLARVFAGQRSNDIAKRNRKLVARLIGRQARVPVIITWGARSEAPEGNLSVAGRLSSSPFGKRSFIEIHQEAATDKANIGHEVAHVLRGDLARGELWRAGEISALGIVAGGVVASAFSSLSLPVMLGLVASAGLATSPLRGFWIKRKLHSLFSQQVSAPFIEQ
jgi:hypothetical protein